MDPIDPPHDLPAPSTEAEPRPANADRWGRRVAAAGRTAPGRAAIWLGERVRAGVGDPLAMLLVVLIGSLMVRIAWLDLPHNSLIFDEAYYVQAARALLGWAIPAGAHYAGSPAGLDPNSEHPPLGKVLMAASMLAFGDNGIGWRVPSVIAGMISLVAVYKIVQA